MSSILGFTAAVWFFRNLRDGKSFENSDLNWTAFPYVGRSFEKMGASAGLSIKSLIDSSFKSSSPVTGKDIAIVIHFN